MSHTTRKNLAVPSYVLGFAIAVAGGVPEATADDTPLAEQASFDLERFEQRFEPPRKNWSLIVGAGAMYKPKYEGSDEFEVSPLPLVLFTYGEWLEIDPTGITLTPFRRGGFSFSGKVGYESGRKEDDHERLNGLGDIDFAATVGARAAYQWGPVELYAAVDQTIDGSESLLGTFGIGYSAPVSEKLILGARAEAIVANGKHMEAYFGVNSRQSALSGLPEYKAEAGLKRVNVSASVTYLLGGGWLLRSQADLGLLIGDAADSPVVERKVQPSVSFAVGYKF